MSVSARSAYIYFPATALLCMDEILAVEILISLPVTTHPPVESPLLAQAVNYQQRLVSLSILEPEPTSAQAHCWRVLRSLPAGPPAPSKYVNVEAYMAQTRPAVPRPGLPPPRHPSSPNSIKLRGDTARLPTRALSLTHKYLHSSWIHERTLAPQPSPDILLPTPEASTRRPAHSRLSSALAAWSLLLVRERRVRTPDATHSQRPALLSATWSNGGVDEQWLLRRRSNPC
ncbi:hypothetical protein B0H19DRAFT_1263965 [Mycena capillaripes]|nr:hypothetical protein B0H19DRAFT_1263965 [Mycena capillaripes]